MYTLICFGTAHRTATADFIVQNSVVQKRSYGRTETVVQKRSVRNGRTETFCRTETFVRSYRNVFTVPLEAPSFVTCVQYMFNHSAAANALKHKHTRPRTRTHTNTNNHTHENTHTHEQTRTHTLTNTQKHTHEDTQ